MGRKYSKKQVQSIQLTFHVQREQVLARVRPGKTSVLIGLSEENYAGLADILKGDGLIYT